MYKLMTPGPVPVPPQILKALSLPIVHHRTEEFSLTVKSVLTNLSKVFQTKMPAFTLSGWGSTGMEAAIVNTLSPGDKVVVLETGKFGERWSEIASSYNLKVEILKSEWGQVPTIDQIKPILSKNNDVKAILCQACETSTGVALPIEQIAKLIKTTNAILIVDAITALGAYNIPMDDWGIDVVVGGSQKAFMLPAGLAFIALSEKAWQSNKQAKLPRFTLDLASELEANKKNQTQFSSATSHLIALDEVLKIMLSQEIKNYFEIIQKRSDYFKNKCLKSGLKLFGLSNSPSLTVIALPEGVDGEKLQKNILKNQNILVAGGQDQLKGKILRVGHMGHMSDQDLDETLTAILQELKLK